MLVYLKHNELLPEHVIKTRLDNCCPNVSDIHKHHKIVKRINHTNLLSIFQKD